MKTLAFAAMVLVAAACSSATDNEQKDLEAEAAIVAAWGVDPVLVNAVLAQNTQNIALTEIQRRDVEWVAGRDTARVRAMTTGACADRLRQLMAAKSIYGETFLMDRQGALVCASENS
jgi:hypothetical protein